MAEPLAYLNGGWIPASAAVVSVDDVGFVQGTTIVERLRTFGGKPFRVQDHLARLARSLEIVGIDPGMTLDQFAAIAEELARRNHALQPPGDDLGLSIFVTPGVSVADIPVCQERADAVGGQECPPHRGRQECLPHRDKHEPTVCLHTSRLPFHHWAKKYREGQRLVTTAVEQVPPQCWSPELKCRSRMHYYLADRQAASIDPQARALLLDAAGFVAEASTANVLVYRAAECLISPPLAKILHGISLSAVAELADRLGIPFRQRDLTVADVATADEVLLTSTSVCMLPVARFNGRPIGDGRPGPIFQQLLAAWSEMVGVDIIAQAESRANG